MLRRNKPVNYEPFGLIYIVDMPAIHKAVEVCLPGYIEDVWKKALYKKDYEVCKWCEREQHYQRKFAVPTYSQISDDNLDQLKYLLRIGADLSSESCLTYLVHHGFLESIKYLTKLRIEFRDVRSVLQTAGYCGRTSILEYLYYCGQNLNAFEEVALNYACVGGHLRCVEFLVSKGCNPLSCSTGIGMKYAARNGHRDIIMYLLDKGCDPKAEDSAALKYACLGGKKDIVEILICAGADPTCDDGYCTRWAYGNNHLDLHQYLTSLSDGCKVARSALGAHRRC